ncbi:cadherin-99C [Anopheles darlingi]|uniref:cadherin-99C n=1 Tax=Anopheles darlingi TaxID=43151 RepID=UPI0021002486|nr:cadherin-99C [Anopheles darlingi]XP_049532009.1 cadherin-99C [Anopheles darlingi]
MTRRLHRTSSSSSTTSESEPVAPWCVTATRRPEMTVTAMVRSGERSIDPKREHRQHNNDRTTTRLERRTRTHHHHHTVGMMVTSFLSNPRRFTSRLLPRPARKAYHSSSMMAMAMLLLLLVTHATIPGVDGKQQLCEVETGQSSIILDIEESRGSSIGQRTNPPELPISGDPNDDITLELVFPKGKPSFLLDGKSLRLIHPLDRDEENLSHIVFQITCMVRSTRRKRNIPIIVRVSDVNDNPPMFINTPYETSVAESTPVGTTIFRSIQATDKDAGVNGLIEYFIVEGAQNVSDISPNTLTAADGHGVFAIAYPHQGQVTVVKTLDYERTQRYYLTIVASDRARNASERLSATTTLTIDVADSDDQDPSFIYRGCVLLDGACLNPEYSASVPAGTLQGVLTVTPERIQAIDLDTISAPIRYSFLSGIPGNYGNYFEIDPQTGVLKQTKLVDASVTAKKFDIIVKAEEVSEMKRYTTAKLAIHVKPVDAFPPMISATATEGYVDENSPIGTVVMDADGNPIKLSTTDQDLGSELGERMEYIYEVTSPSFTVSKEGVLRVNEEGLDRDPPSQERYLFQVVAREATGNAASAPLSVTVVLRDVNDNAPRLAMVAPVTLMAGDGRRLVTKVHATDNDAAENALITYSIFHVSNNGASKFAIDAKTGEIETRTRLNAGEQYSITVQASDVGGLSSQAIVEVTITPGPNTKPPRFAKPVYEVQVSEGAEINSTVLVLKAEDPENDPVSYAITTGNDLRQFSIGKDSGVISVIRKLDREDLTRYQLIVRAEDNGGLASSATVNIRVTDINDKNPEFDERKLPYVFAVDEGQEGVAIGTVHATDADEGMNAEISYTIPSDIPFRIDSRTGEIRTKLALDYEKQKEYKFVVTAKDGAPEPRLGTASVTVKVRDIPDEVPRFMESTVEVRIPENIPDTAVTTVRAFDPDTKPEITYTLRRGPGDLFKVDARTGQIKTIRGLDYEKDKMHELIIGTLENDGNGPGDFIKILVEVEDRNDIPPVFVSIPEPVNINDNLPIGAIVGSMPAVDGDGSSPGNVVRYELVGRGKALKYFQVDADSGMVRIRDDLGKEEDNEYLIDVRAYDMGEPQLSSVSTLPVYVSHIPANPNGDSAESRVESGGIVNLEVQGLAFSDDSYTTSVPESTGVNATVKLVQIINSKKATKHNGGFSCELTGGNEQQLFRITIEDHACAIVLNAPLDYETTTSHTLQVRLASNKYFVNQHKNTASVKVIVQDENDNVPQFVFPKTYQQSPRNDTYYAVINADADVETPLLQVKATDRDVGPYGQLKYVILDEDHASNEIPHDDTPSTYFTISEDTGMIKTQKSFQGVRQTPLVFLVEVRDNNGMATTTAGTPVHRARARVVVNLIADINRMTLVFLDSNPKDMRRHVRALEELLHEKSDGLITGIERVTVRKVLNENGTVEEVNGATDVWFYAVDPKTERLLERNSSTVVNRVLAPAILSQINFEASSIARATAQGIFGPIEPKVPIQKIKATIVGNDEVFPYALIAVAIVIVILGSIGIVYICISWSKYKNFKQRMRQYTAPASPVRYDPVMINSQQPPSSENPTSLKEYETQVLAMAVPLTDEGDDLQLDFSAKNHAFSLDNVSYITHKENGQHSPTNSDATTAVVGTLQRNNNINAKNNNNLSTINNRQNTLNRTLEMNRNNYLNPLGAVANGTVPGTLTLGRIKSERNNYINGYGDTLNRNNLTMAQNNTFNTLGRNQRNLNHSTPHGGNNNNANHAANNININNGHLHNGHAVGQEVVANTLGRNNRYNDVPITNPLFHIRQNGDLQSQPQLNHMSPTNENVSFGKRDYNQLSFSYLNDLDRSDAETTTEL